MRKYLNVKSLLLFLFMLSGCGSIFIITEPRAGEIQTVDIEFRSDCSYLLEVTFIELNGDRTKAKVTSLFNNKFGDLGLDYDSPLMIVVAVKKASSTCPFNTGDRWVWPEQPSTGVSRKKLPKDKGGHRIDLYDFQRIDAGFDLLIKD